MTSQNLRSVGASWTKRSFWALGLGIALTAALPGCVAHAQGELVADYPAEYVESVPPRIEYYPRTYYRGSPAYLVEGRWYYRTHDRWIVFREEPVELRDYRVRQSPAYLGPSNRYYGRSQERIIAERRAQERRQIDERRADARRAEARREAERRAQDERRRERSEAEQRRAEQQRQAEHRRVEEQRAAERRREDDHRVAERPGRAARKRDRSHGDQHDSRDERDRRRFRQD
jgi:hypothetical protein